ncbi:MAG: hypothetical protein ACKVWV_03470 [Planctomycetota bacterium]
MRNLTRSSPWLVMAVAIHVILGAIAAIAAIAVVHTNSEAREEVVTSIHVSGSRETLPEDFVLPPEPIDRKAIPKNEQAELVSFEEDVFVPTTEAQAEDLHLDRGDPAALDNLPSGGTTGGTAIGVGAGGHAGSGLPTAFGGRRLGLGVPKGRTGGATQGTEKSVLEGLRWLARHQNDDGSWGASSIAMHCTTNPPCAVVSDVEHGKTFDVGMTSLSLLAFLGHGLSVDSKLEIVDTAMGTKRVAGDIVRRGVKWLLAQQKLDGSFSGAGTFEFPENDTLSTMALCEAFGLSRNLALKRPAQRALDFLVAAQKRNEDGSRSGWGMGSYADLSAKRERGELEFEQFVADSQSVEPTVTCWVVMALQSARTCGFDVPEDVLAGALAYVVAATGDSRAPSSVVVNPDDAFTYHAARERAVGMLTRTFAGGAITDEYLEGAARALADDVPKVTKDGKSVDFYYWYFGTIALNQFDGPDSPRKSGKYWNAWNRGLVDSILELQDDSSERDVCSRGGWLQTTRGDARGLELRNTALNVLTLEVYYRFDNVFGVATRN